MIKFLLSLILLTNFSFAQSDFDSTPSGILIDKQLKKRDSDSQNELKESEPTGLAIDAKGKQVGTTPEWNYTYLRFAQNSVSFFEKEKGNSLTLGHRQVADSFYYDLQYNILNTDESKTKAQTISMGLGWHASWRHRLLPYFGAQLGYSWMNSDKLNVSENGFYTGVDGGVILKRYYPFLFILGTRFGVHNYSSEKVRNITSQEVYFSVGLEAF